MRRVSLIARILAVAVIVAVASVVGTAWLASTTASRFDLQLFAKNQAADARIADALSGYAATHSTWTDVQPFIDSLARRSGRRIALSTAFGSTVADTKAGVTVPPDQQIRIDPLANGYSDDGPEVGQIDPRAVGPYRLTAAQLSLLHAQARRVAACAQNSTTRVSRSGNGRPVVQSKTSSTSCGQQALAKPVGAETAALAALVVLVNQCLALNNTPSISSISTDLEPEGSTASAISPTVLSDCLHTGRAEQLRPWVAPALDVTMTDAVGDQRGPADLTRGSVARIALISAGILILVLGVVVATGLPIIRRVRALTAAAEQLANGESDVQVPVRGNDELASLGRSFNRMSQERQRSEDLRAQLISDVAHELRTPLTNLVGWLEAAEDGVADYDAALNRTLLDETHQLARIVADLQTLTLADGGGLRLRRDEIDLWTMLSTVAESHAQRALTGGVRIEFEVEPGLVVEGDGGRLQQVMDNLVSNALDHTPPGGTIAITGARIEDVVRLAVTDSGVGIAAEDLHSVFERFWRADKSRARVSGGSGLGLSIVRKLVEAHGGTVGVSSQLGRGSTFTIDLRSPL